MGQYYIAILKKDGEKQRSYYASVRFSPPTGVWQDHMKESLLPLQDGTYFVSWKLMCQVNIDNPYTNGVVQALMKHGPARVAWIGDYARQAGIKFEHGIVDPWESETEPVCLTPYQGHLLTGMYIVNWTKKEFVSYDKYISDNECLADDSELCCHPIPLLTAVSNSSNTEFGGFSSEVYSGKSNVLGAWAFDVLSIEKEPPANFSEVRFLFLI